jgi:hypothetical protein
MGAAMKTFLMCEPRHFDVIYDISPWMSANIGSQSTIGNPAMAKAP